MRRFVGLLLFVFFAFPLGLSVAGCGHGTAVVYCNGSGYGPTTGQVKSITLSSNLVTTGESVNYGQIGNALSASAVDCNNQAVSVSSFVYSSTDPSIADVNPANGTVCGGTWNRNTGGGIANFTVCTPPVSTTNHTAFITAAGGGATSNSIEVFIHAPVTSVVLGPASADCVNDPASSCTQCNPNLIGATLPDPSTVQTYSSASCFSQNTVTQLIARVYAGATNITCQAGPIAFALQSNTSVANINAQGYATLGQPGSALVTATVSNSSSALNAGLLSTCPPSAITLTAVGQAATANNIPVAINAAQTFIATVYDTNKNKDNNFQGNQLTGLQLEFNSTLPVNFPTTGDAVDAAYPGTANITAVCQPPSCNPAPFSQIGVNGNGVPVTSNGITVTAPGTSSDVLYMGSLGSQYIVSRDFTTSTQTAPLKLPYTPTSMVISQDGSIIYMGSSGGLMTVATASGTVSGTYQQVQGNVLAVAPNNSYAVVTDPARQTVSLVTSTGGVFSSFNGVGTRAQWTPDSTTLYVTTNTDQLLTYSTLLGWQPINTAEQYTDVAVTVPNLGAYFAGTSTTDGRTVCPSTTAVSTATPPVATNTFYPLADQAALPTDRVSYTTDGKHLLGATVAGGAPTLQDLVVTLPTQNVGGVTTIAPCPPPPNPIAPGFFSDTHTTHPLTGISASSITGVIPAGNSNVAFVTYNGASGTTSNLLPLYVPSTGALSNVTLSGAATAPIAGVFSTDNTNVYVGTAGDNVVHTIGVTGTTAVETGVITPALPAVSGTGIATPNLIVLRARKPTA